MNLDFQLFEAINRVAGKNPFVDHIMALWTQYGPLVFGLVLLWMWFSKKENPLANRRAVLLAVASAAVALGMNQLIGAVYFRPRPFVDHLVTLLVAPSGDPSFPSDHATGAFALALAVWRLNKKWGYGMLVLAVFLAFSRVYVGAHYPLDVIGGAITGLMGAWIIGWQRRRLEPVMEWVLEKWDKMEKKVIKKEM